ncbi:MAG: hypothetical protein KF702_07305, partial [Gammaproteobacteria bacterium]|nr:hypothetical protein [Gammaproteobacteria bacterium]
MRTLGKNIFLYATLILFSTMVFGVRWPVFLAPDKEFLLKQNYIDTSQCPPGEGKLNPSIVLNISQFFCKTFCPSKWSWIVNSDNKCHHLSTDFIFKNYVIEYIFNQDGTVNYSLVTAAYGRENSPTSFFTFKFMTPVGEYWGCFEMNPALHFISCTND